MSFERSYVARNEMEDQPLIELIKYHTLLFKSKTVPGHARHIKNYPDGALSMGQPKNFFFDSHDVDMKFDNYAHAEVRGLQNNDNGYNQGLHDQFLYRERADIDPEEAELKQYQYRDKLRADLGGNVRRTEKQFTTLPFYCEDTNILHSTLEDMDVEENEYRKKKEDYINDVPVVLELNDEDKEYLAIAAVAYIIRNAEGFFDIPIADMVTHTAAVIDEIFVKRIRYKEFEYDKQQETMEKKISIEKLSHHVSNVKDEVEDLRAKLAFYIENAKDAPIVDPYYDSYQHLQISVATHDGTLEQYPIDPMLRQSTNMQNRKDFYVKEIDALTKQLVRTSEELASEIVRFGILEEQLAIVRKARFDLEVEIYTNVNNFIMLNFADDYIIDSFMSSINNVEGFISAFGELLRFSDRAELALEKRYTHLYRNVSERINHKYEVNEPVTEKSRTPAIRTLFLPITNRPFPYDPSNKREVFTREIERLMKKIRVIDDEDETTRLKLTENINQSLVVSANTISTIQGVYDRQEDVLSIVHYRNNKDLPWQLWDRVHQEYHETLANSFSKDKSILSKIKKLNNQLLANARERKECEYDISTFKSYLSTLEMDHRATLQDEQSFLLMSYSKAKHYSETAQVMCRALQEIIGRDSTTPRYEYLRQQHSQMQQKKVFEAWVPDLTHNRAVIEKENNFLGLQKFHVYQAPYEHAIKVQMEPLVL